MTATIKAPIPGTFYRQPAPGDPPFKDVGDTVAVGEVIGLIEVMKSFFDVKSKVSGKITAFLVENEAPVTAGEDLVTLAD
ncbi:MAG: acetyl-CoA carboxylase [Candidatus Symbiobacter sp.]|nr:acetyl-CoA carboxylase [Candidatus Symbiobacter sp.]